MIDRRDFLRNCLVSLGALGIGTCSSRDGQKSEGPGTEDALPNIVLILADDMGYGDIRAYNPDSKIPTPNLNRLAEDGIRFTDAHSGSAVCSPTRYGLLTGRYSWRTWMKSGVLWPPEDRPLIEPERLTLAALLKQRGYQTACFGKWHLGLEWGRSAEGEVDFNAPLLFGPNDVGFDESMIIAGSLDMIPYAFYRDHKPTAEVSEIQPGLPFPRFIREGPRAADFEPEAVLDRLTDEAVGYIETQAGGEAPFFLYFPMTAPHKPVWPAERFRDTSGLGPYGDFVKQTDWSVGRVLEALDRTGVQDNTLVIFTSDNGSYMYRWPEDQPDHLEDAGIQGFHPSNHTANDDWRGTKADIWEAGHRVPFIVRWPGRAKPQTRCELTICLTDVLATCAEISGITLPDEGGEDSFSLLPLVQGEGWASPRPPVIHHSSQGTFSLREGRWKMVFGSGSGGREKPVGKPFEEPYFLFDIENDPSETTNLIEQHPDVAERLTNQLELIMRNPGSRSIS